jgi:glyoxylase-like metal-dependent hydrolase (beta-lactamase superfamily II)
MKITDRVYLVGGSGFGYSPTGDCNVYLIDGGAEMALIDTGGGNGVKKMLYNVKAMDLDPKKIKVAFNTHAHFDHIGGNYEFKQATKCEIAAHTADKKAIEDLDERSLYSMSLERGLEFQSTEVEITLNGGDKYQVGDVSLEIIHNPGHTPGCISIKMIEDEKVSIFCGDIAGANGRLGYINGPGFDLNDWKASIKKLISYNPERLYPGHNTFLLGDTVEHLKAYDAKMNAAWTTIVTSIG